jgi:phosphoglycerate dehydrogenase-like enzyme
VPGRPVITVLCATDGARPPHLEPIEARAEVRYVGTDRLATAIKGADALFLWDFFSEAVRDVWDQADSLRWIHVAAAGVDRLLFDELIESDVVVTNARGTFDRPIAEFVLASILAFAKDVHRSHDLQRARVWQHREPRSISGSTALIVGTGAIGREIARLLRVVGMSVRGAGRTARSSDPDFDAIVAAGELPKHVGWADHLVIVAPLTAQTRGLVNSTLFAAMKPTAHLVNVGRGACVVEADLIKALDNGRIAGASLDVFATEPLAPDNPLWTVPGVVITPHMCADVVGWLDSLAHQFVDNAERWLDNRPLMNTVDKRLGFVPYTSGDT